MPYLLLLLALAFGASPWLVPDFGGFDPEQFPIPQENPSVQPAGYAFAIWGVIYVWLVLGLAFAAWRKQTDDDWRAMQAPMALSLAVGAIWLPVAKLSPVWATILIWVMLLGALGALWRVPSSAKWALAYPLGLYTGWLSGASFVAIGLLLGGYGWLAEDTTAWVMIMCAGVLAAWVQSQRSDVPTYGIAAIWALIAIAVQNAFDLGSPALAALLAAALVAVVLARGILTSRSVP